VPDVTVMAGRTEEIPVDDASCDVVIGASTWHCIDEARAVPEVARVLRPGATFTLLWSDPDRSVDWMRSLWSGGKLLDKEQIDHIDARRRERPC
jgi:SAM-dependent methyltransferase